MKDLSFEEKKNFFDRLLEMSPAAVYIIQEGRFRLVNPEFEKITGYSSKEIEDIDPIELVFPEDREKIIERQRRTIKGEISSPYEFRIMTKDGKVKWVVERVSLIEFEGKKAILANFMDITEMKRMEKELSETKKLLEQILSVAPVGLGIAENRVIGWANDEMVRIFGYENKEEFVGLHAKKLYVSEKEYERVGELYEVLKKRKTAEADVRFKKKDGTPFWGHLRFIAFDPRSPEKKVAFAILDITKRKSLEERLYEEKEFLDVTLRSIGDGVICTDKEGRVTLMNRVAEELTGWKEEEAIGKNLKEVFHIVDEKTRERCEDPVQKVLKTGKVVGLANNTVLISKDGKERLLSDSGAPIKDKEGNILGVVLVFRDVTEKRKIETELQRMEKLESIGVLAGGIAHDMNNLLMAILGHVSLAKLSCDPESDVYRKLEDIERAVINAKSLTQQLLTFSKGGAPIRKPISIKELIKESARFALSGTNVSCRFSIEDDLWMVEADEAQLRQVICNIVINAQQAMPSGGVIDIKAENVFVKGEIPIKEGRYVKISIKDYGIGIPKEHLSKIFDPFFTTKQKGSGLGLTTAYNIIRNHDGYITVDSELGKGTRVDIYIPACEKEIKQEKREFFSKKRVLLMDDEELVLEVVKEMLRAIGFEVEAVKDGKEAVEIYRKAKEEGKEFDAVILDLTVPAGMGGKEALERILQIDPSVKAIVSSGYSNDPIMSEYKKYGFKAVITKPYTIQELQKVLNEVLRE